MEQETLFTASKWDILTELRIEPRSPMELAKILNTSVANISQQLRLLEMAGLVESKRVSNREKGLPRVLYTLSGNHSYIIATAKEFVDKKLHKLTETNKVVLRIWFYDDPSIRYYLEKAFWSINDKLTREDALLLDTGQRNIRLIVVSENDPKFKDLEIENPNGKKATVKFEVLNPEEFKKKNPDREKYYQLYDPASIFNDDTENGDNSERNN